MLQNFSSLDAEGRGRDTMVKTLPNCQISPPTTDKREDFAELPNIAANANQAPKSQSRFTAYSSRDALTSLATER